MTATFASMSCDWTRHAFSLITPDALYRGKLASVLRHYEAEGFRIEHGMLFDATCVDVDELYSDHIEQQWEVYRFRLVDRLVHFGRSLALLLSHDSLEGTDLYAHLTAVKGSSDPYKAAPGTIRYEAGAMNAIVGVLHASDNPVEAAREAAIFFDSPTARPIDRATVQAFAAVNEAAARLPAPSFDATIGRLRFEICLAAGPLLDASMRARVLSTACHDVEALADPALGIEFAAALDAPRIGPLDLRRWLAADFWPGAPDTPDVPSECDQLSAIGVTLSAWERLVLETATYFPSMSRYQRTLIR